MRTLFPEVDEKHALSNDHSGKAQAELATQIALGAAAALC